MLIRWCLATRGIPMNRRSRFVEVANLSTQLFLDSGSTHFAASGVCQTLGTLCRRVKMQGDSQLTERIPAHGHFKTERMNAVTDGVFAIVMTLLVLELKLPERDESILVLLRDDWHVFLAWLISFLAIARFWLVHHSVTAGMRQCNTVTLNLNFAVLGAVSLVPFSADTIGTERLSEPWSTVVFAANIGLLSLTVGLMARHAAREPHLLHPGHPVAVLGRHRAHHLYVLPTITFAAALLAFVHPYLAVALLTTEFVFFGWVSSRRR
jgi:uncharacterized membrane protein